MAKFGTPMTKTGGIMMLLGIAITFAANLMAPHIAAHEPGDASYVPPSTAAALVWGLGALSFVIGIGLMLYSFRHRKRAPAPNRAEALRPIIETRKLPFSVCSHCQIVFELEFGFACPECGEQHTCMRVEKDDERSTALAALGPP